MSENEVEKVLDEMEELIISDIRKREAIFITELDTIINSFENIKNTYIEQFNNAINLFNKIDVAYGENEVKERLLKILDKHIKAQDEFVNYFIDEENLFIKRLDKFVNEDNSN